MNWNVLVTGPAQKDLAKLPARDRARVNAAFIAMQVNPFAGDIARLRAQPAAWRRRIGDWRILYDVYLQQRMVVITGIKRRTSTTY
jgi:mRNA-degrading endonuclease RelE of RelBE toxin-antitoxin system